MAYDAARAALQISAEPGTLPCREAEHQEITGFFANAISNPSEADRYLCMHPFSCSTACLTFLDVAGLPGTGKTATVRAVLHTAQTKAASGQWKKFDSAWLNALRLANPSSAFPALYKALTGEKAGLARSRDLLDARFTKATEHTRPAIVVIDEMDALAVGRQRVLYMLLEWVLYDKFMCSAMLMVLCEGV